MDTFLAAHKLPGIPLFNLSRIQRTISIRDQMVRAMMLADRLPDWLQTQPKRARRRVLVVGAGAAGVTAALGLAAARLDVEIADRYEMPFHLQLECSSRWLDPTQYDWPLDHWQTQRFPLPPPWDADTSFPLTWGPDLANDVARGWTWRWPANVKRLRSFTGTTAQLYKPVKTRDPDGRTCGLKVRLTKGSKKRIRSYGAVVRAAGFGGERVHQAIEGGGFFFGFPFWANDDCRHLNHLLISGSGDGALQDLIHAVTDTGSAAAVMEWLRPLRRTRRWDQSVREIQSCEQRLERSIAWRVAREKLQHHRQRLHAVTQAHVDGLLGQNPKLVERLQRRLFGIGPSQITLVSPSPYFDCNYALNRFVAMVLIHVLDSRIRIVSGHKLKWLQHEGPGGIPAPLRDVIHPERVGFQDRVRLARLGRKHRWTAVVVRGDSRASIHGADGVIIRHGLDKTNPPTDQPKAKPLEVPLAGIPEAPYYVPERYNKRISK